MIGVAAAPRKAGRGAAVASGAAGHALELDLPAVAESCPKARQAVREALGGAAVEMSAVDLAVT
jgi:hypothetical protein